MRIALIAALVSGIATPASSQSSSEQARREAQQYLIRCPPKPRDENELCKFHHAEFIRNYAGARSGAYDDQRQVAYSLQHGNDGSVTVNMPEACAWQLLIVASGDPRTQRSDVEVAGTVCAHLDEASRLRATARAARLDREARLLRTR